MSEDIDYIFKSILEIGNEIKEKIDLNTESGNSTTNIYGDVQNKLDLVSNEIFINKFKNSKIVKSLASEEMDEIITIGTGKYVLTFDPLDGSSNILSNNLLGTIIAIFNNDHRVLKNLEASVYILYGPMLTAVIAYNGKVSEYIYHPLKNIWQIKNENIRLPSTGWVYGIGGKKVDWPDWLKKFETDILEKYKLRYGGALVGDFNQLLHYGGFFAYPELKNKSKGKYRAYFESIPMALIIKNAGGLAVDGEKDLLDGDYPSINEIVPTYFGNVELIEKMKQYRKRKA